jgi:hypothetical protein
VPFILFFHTKQTHTKWRLQLGILVNLKSNRLFQRILVEFNCCIVRDRRLKNGVSRQILPLRVKGVPLFHRAVSRPHFVLFSPTSCEISLVGRAEKWRVRVLGRLPLVPRVRSCDMLWVFVYLCGSCWVGMGADIGRETPSKHTYIKHGWANVVISLSPAPEIP